MQGLHVFNPRAKTEIDLESAVEDDHELRKIDRVLDMAFVRELTAACYADGIGRPSIDPEFFFRMELVAYLNGITSDRRLGKEVRYNLAYRWFCHLALDEDVPDHSSLSRIRDRFDERIFSVWISPCFCQRPLEQPVCTAGSLGRYLLAEIKFPIIHSPTFMTWVSPCWQPATGT